MLLLIMKIYFMKKYFRKKVFFPNTILVFVPTQPVHWLFHILSRLPQHYPCVCTNTTSTLVVLYPLPSSPTLSLCLYQHNQYIGCFISSPVFHNTILVFVPTQPVHWLFYILSRLPQHYPCVCTNTTSTLVVSYPLPSSTTLSLCLYQHNQYIGCFISSPVFHNTILVFVPTQPVHWLFHILSRL